MARHNGKNAPTLPAAAPAPIPLPPKKHRSSSRSREAAESTTTTAAIASAASNSHGVCSTNTCLEHEYDEYCPGAYVPAMAPLQPTLPGRQINVSSQSAPTGGGSGNVHPTSMANTTTAKYHQRAATFDSADAREYELRRLGNRRSQSQVVSLKYRNGGNGMSVVHGHASLNGLGGVEPTPIPPPLPPLTLTTVRSHDRERSRSEHRLGGALQHQPQHQHSTTCEDNGMLHAYSSNVLNGGVNYHHTRSSRHYSGAEMQQQQQQQSTSAAGHPHHHHHHNQQPQQQQHHHHHHHQSRPQHRREKTFKV